MSRPTFAKIDLRALKNNLSKLVAMAGNSKIVSVVKADAYGNGAVEVAKVLESQSEILAVAFIEEAIELRDAGIKKTILVLQGAHEPADFLLGKNQNVIWIMHAQWQLDAYTQFVLTQKCEPKAWFKFDTGMHRLGFATEDFTAIMQSNKLLINEHSVIVTHLACADEPKQAHTEQQIAAFLRVVGQTDLGLCIANSAAHIRFVQSRKHYVRLGIAIYGSTPFQADDNPIQLEPVMHLSSQIIALRTIPKGDTVGYGGTWRAARKSVIATVALGYADGYPRQAPAGTPAWCKDMTIPLVGRVSMDMLTFDVTDVAEVAIGDAVQLWGDKLSINAVADHIGTIGYELMTRVSSRVPRRYVL